MAAFISKTPPPRYQPRLMAALIGSRHLARHAALPFAVIRTPTDRAGALRTWFAGCIATTAPSPIFRPPHD